MASAPSGFFHGRFLEGRAGEGKTVGVFGATGYTGREVVRLLAVHPEARVELHHRHRRRPSRPRGRPGARGRRLLSSPCPTVSPRRYAAKLRERFPRAVVVDLSGDLRLPTAAAYKEWYGHDHPAPGAPGPGRPTACTEVFRERSARARASSRTPAATRPRCCCRCCPSLRATPGRCRRHRGGREERRHRGRPLAARGPALLRAHGQLLGLLPGPDPSPRGRDRGRSWPKPRASRVALTFCPHLLPVKRGILSAIYVKTDRVRRGPGRGARRVLRRVAASCGWWTRRRGSPTCHTPTTACSPCTPRPRAGSVVFSALDNLVKGAAGQAIQNLNVALGLGRDGSACRDRASHGREAQAVTR